MKESRKREIRIETEKFRQRCSINRYGIINLFNECSKMGYKSLRYPLGETNCLGFAIKKDHDIVIFSNTSCRLSRELFTVAHEIGHTILHFYDSSAFLDDSSTLSDKSTDDKEQEANYFAACLLMPEDEIKKFIDIEVSLLKDQGMTAFDIAKMMSEFHVSFDMALNRLESLGFITKEQRSIIDCEKNEKRVGNLLKRIGGTAKLNEPSGETDIPYEFLEYAIYNYNNSAIPEDTLKRVLDFYSLSIEDISDKIKSFDNGSDDDLEDMIKELQQ